MIARGTTVSAVKTFTMRIALFCTLACLAYAMPSGRQVLNLSEERAPGEFLIVLRQPSARTSNVQYSSAVSDKITALSSKITVLKKFTNLQTPILLVKTSDESIISSLFQLQEVEIVEANTIEKIDVSTQECATQNTGSRLWGLSRVSSVPMPNYIGATHSYDTSYGEGVRVYILDTGVRLSHRDFAGRSEWGKTTVPNTGDDDRNGHGTHCAGTAMGTEYGVAKRATVVAVKCLSDAGSGQKAYSIEGIDWAVGDLARRGVRGVISMSLGGSTSTAQDSAVNSADAAGVPVVVAAGNNNGNACNGSPSRASGAITVGSTDINDNLSSFSNWGSCVNMLAPGSSILSASHTSDTGGRTLSGTSMACPHVAGHVANYLSQNPNASSAQVKSYISSTATTNAINIRGTSGTPNLLMYSTC